MDNEFREPKLESAVGRAGEKEGWSWFEQQAEGDGVDATSRRMRQEGDRVAEAAAGLYATSPEFRIVLEWMLDVTLRRATWSPQLGVAADQIYGHGCFREGQNSMAEALLKVIARGRKE